MSDQQLAQTVDPKWTHERPRPSYQLGTLSLRGKKCKVWVGRWREDVLASTGEKYRVRRREVFGKASELTENEARNLLEHEVRRATLSRAAVKEKHKWRPKPGIVYRDKSWRARHLRRSYGLSVERYNEMRQQQGFKCGICRDPETSSTSLEVDHDHKTLRTRALLCAGCNRGLGSFRERSEALRAAADYINNHL